MAGILHMADMHLGSAFTSRLGEGAAQLRRSEQCAVFSRITDIARERADVLLISGDLFDSPDVSDETISFVKRSFASIPDTQVFIAAGNHDPFCGGSVYETQDFGSNVHIFPADGGYFDLDDLKLRICGASFSGADGSNMPRLGELKMRGGYTNIAVIHGDITGGASIEGRYNPITPQEIAESGFDYAALGHIHVFDGVHKDAGTYRAYPGIPEPRGFDENSARGKYGVIYIETGGDELKFEHIDVHERMYHVLNINLTPDIADSERVTELISERISAFGASDLFKIVLKGRTPSGFKPNTDVIAERLKDRAFFVRVIDETDTERDLTADPGDNSLRAAYIRLLNERIANAADDEDKRIAERALILGVDAIDGNL